MVRSGGINMPYLGICACSDVGAPPPEMANDTYYTHMGIMGMKSVPSEAD